MLFTVVDVIEEEQIVDCNQPDTEDGFGFENEDEDGVAMVEEANSGSKNILYKLYAETIVLSIGELILSI